MASQNNQAYSDQSNGLAEILKQIAQLKQEFKQDQVKLDNRVAQLDYSLQKEREINATMAQKMAQLKRTIATLTTENNMLKYTIQTSNKTPSFEMASPLSAASLPTSGPTSVNNTVEPDPLSSQPPSSKLQLTYHSAYTSALSKQQEGSTGYYNLFQNLVKRQQIKVTEEYNYTCSSFNEVQGQSRFKTQNTTGQDAQTFSVHNENNSTVLASDHQLIQSVSTVISKSTNHIIYGANKSSIANIHFCNQNHSVGRVDKQPLWENCAVATNRLEACNLNHYTQQACN